MALGGALGLAWSPVTPGTPRHFAWQAWHKLTSTVVLRGRRGTTSHPPSFCVAGVALMALGGALGLAWLPVTPVTPRHFAWQAWHKLTSTVVLRGRRGATSHPPSFCVAGVAQPDIHLRFTWQAWHKLTSTFVSRGRRGTYGTGWRAWTGLVARDARDAAALCVAGVAQPDIHLRFTWQAWHKLTSTFVSRGRRGTYGTGQVKLVICMQRCGPCSWSRSRAQLRFSNAVQRRHDRFCFLHADFHHVVLVVLFWSN